MEYCQLQKRAASSVKSSRLAALAKHAEARVGYEDARTKHKILQMERMQILNSYAKGDLIAYPDVEYALATTLDRFVTMLEGLPSRISSALAVHGVKPAAARRIILDEVRLQRQTLSNMFLSLAGKLKEDQIAALKPKASSQSTNRKNRQRLAS